MATRKITPALEKEILAKATEGLSSRAIAAWLGRERGVPITHQAIGKLLRQTRASRAEVTKVVVRETLAKTVVSDLERLRREQGRVERLGRRLYKRAVGAMDQRDALLAKLKKRASEGAEGDPKEGKSDDLELRQALVLIDTYARLALTATDRAARLTDLKLHYAGADSDEESDPSRMKTTPNDELLSRLDGLADRLAASGEAQGGDTVPQ